jgi:hypothetical protein
MCTELFLAIIYFITIFIVNYFLYKLLSVYVINIVYLFKLKNIFSKFPKTDVKSLALLYFYSKNNFKNINVFGVLNQFSNSNDTLVIGKSYEYLANNVEVNNRNNITLIYYLRLLENQYLPIKKINM